MTRLIVFGTGDLTTRYLLPALAELVAANALPDGVSVTVAGRREMSTTDLLDGLEGRGDRLPDLTYRRANPTDAAAVRALVGNGAPDDPVVAYLALPPSVFADAVDALGAAHLPAGSGIVVEKPFGDDAESAAALNRKLLAVVPEERVFRVDHFLGKQTAHDVLTLRFANSVFEPLWNHRHIASVEIVWDETLALEGRAGYYDGTGALRDMIQNHLLQLLCLVAMEPPDRLSGDAVGARRVEVLRATRPWDAAAAAHNVRGRYVAGQVGDREVPSYVDEDGVEPGRGTETYARVTFAVATPRWSGVPFVLRSGKAMSTDRHEITIRFRSAPPVGFCADEVSPNVLRFGVDPTRVTLDAVLTAGHGVFATAPVELSSRAHEPSLSAYATVLAGVLGTEDVLSVRGDEAEEAWRVVEPVLEAWHHGVVPLVEYPAGSPGPTPS
ncbi:MAG: glucose-6-phosphate dehydrogenase [Ilumatobacteraceae bacterium]